MDTNDTRSRRGRTAGLVAAGLVGGVVLAGFATANAQTDPTPSPSQGTTTEQAPMAKGPGGRGHGPGKGGHGQGIHGEFVTAAPNGGWQTIATQKGEVTAVSATSITVRSEDDFSRTYSVDDNTLVNAGNNGIADVKTGDDVHVMAIVTDGKAAAVDVRDTTQVGRIRERFAPRPQAPETAPSAATSGASA